MQKVKVNALNFKPKILSLFRIITAMPTLPVMLLTTPYDTTILTIGTEGNNNKNSK